METAFCTVSRTDMMITAEAIFKSAAALGAKRSVDDYCILIENLVVLLLNAEIYSVIAFGKSCTYKVVCI